MSAPIQGQPGPVNVLFTKGPFGGFQVTYHNGTTEVTAQSGTLEGAIGKAAGENAPENYILHTAAILRGIFQRSEK